MTSVPPPEYVLARSVLLDALQALGPHLDAVVLVGAQAVYFHTGNVELIVVPTTTDADLALFPAKLLDEPLLEDALRAAGFELGANPGAWRGRFGVAVDLMVPEALSGGSSRRSARLPIHGNRAARRTTGLEPALVDNDFHGISAFEAADSRSVRLRVAGPAALLVAKVTKIEERRGTSGRHQPKDGLDILRLLQATPTKVMSQRLVRLVRDPLAGVVTATAIAALQRDGRDPAGLIASLAGRAVGNLADPDTVSGSVAVLIEELLAALDAVDDDPAREDCPRRGVHVVMRTEPTAGGDAIDRASAAFWKPEDIDTHVLGTDPLTAHESFAIADVADDEWEAFARALHE